MKANMNTDIFESTKPDILLGEKRFYLNCSKTKYVTVSLSYDLNFTPCITISGNRNNIVMFSEKEWEEFLTQKEVIDNFMEVGENCEPIDIGKFWMEFDKFQECKVIKIMTGYATVWLGQPSIAELWRILPLVKHTLETLKSQQFASCFKLIELGVKNSEDVINTALNIIEPIKVINPMTYAIALEIIYKHPEILKNEKGNFQ